MRDNGIEIINELKAMDNEMWGYLGSQFGTFWVDGKIREIKSEHYLTRRKFTDEEKANLEKKYKNLGISERKDGHGVIAIYNKKLSTYKKYIKEGKAI